MNLYYEREKYHDLTQNIYRIMYNISTQLFDLDV
jgi:hypothetical protein